MARPQNRYIALLRGINVGGHTIIKMADLRNLFESLGFTNVASYIQTGNVLFSTKDTDSERLAQQLEKELESLMGRRIRVFVLSPAELKKAAAHNPFEPEHAGEKHRCNLMFLSDAPEPERRKALMALQGEEYRFHIHGKLLYYTYSQEYVGKRRTIDFEKVLRVAGTVRTWKVIAKLIEMSEAKQDASKTKVSQAG